MDTGKLAAAVATLAIGVSATAAAEVPGPYVVAFGGESSIDIIKQSRADATIVELLGENGLDVVDGTSSLDDSDIYFGLALGYKVNDYFAVELAYVDLGATSYRASVTVNDGEIVTDAVVDAEVSAKGPVGSLLGIWPVHENFTPFLRFGLSLLDTSAKISTDFDGGASDHASTTRSNVVFGVGLDWLFAEHFGLRAEWDRYFDVGSADLTGEGDIDTYSLGLRYEF